MVEGNGVCTIYLVRHGESEANAKKIVQGQTDSSLTNDGKIQAAGVREALKDVRFDAIFSSDLGRSIQTAGIIRGERDVEIQTSRALREKSYGTFEGVDHGKFIDTLKVEFDRFDKELSIEERWDHKAHPSIESDRELLQRFFGYIRKIVGEYSGKTILIVSHRFTIRMFLVSLGYSKYENLKGGGLKYCGYAVVEADGDNFSVSTVVGQED